MPSKPKVPCRHPGCSKLVDAKAKYCEKHKALHLNDEVHPASPRDYNSAWRKARKAYLRAHPLCVRCMAVGKYTKATVVDHIIPHRGDKQLFWNQSNWQSLCKPCHDRKTWTEDKNPEYKY